MFHPRMALVIHLPNLAASATMVEEFVERQISVNVEENCVEKERKNNGNLIQKLDHAKIVHIPLQWQQLRSFGVLARWLEQNSEHLVYRIQKDAECGFYKTITSFFSLIIPVSASVRSIGSSASRGMVSFITSRSSVSARRRAPVFGS